MSREVISTPNAPQAIGPYSQAIRCGGFLFLSGQIPLDPKSGEMVGEGDVRAQTRRVMDNICALLESAGGHLGSVAKTTIFLTDLGDFAVVNEVYGSYFGELPPPARSTIQVAALPRGAKVEIEVIALVES